MCLVPLEPRRECWILQELELWMLVSQDVSDVKQTGVHWKLTKCSSLGFLSQLNFFGNIFIDMPRGVYVG